MFEGLKSIFLAGKLKYQRMQDEITEREIWNKYAESLTTGGRKRLLKSFEDDDEDNWALMGAKDEKQLNEEDHRTLIKEAQKKYYKNAHARHIIRQYEKYVCGRGFKMTPKTTNELWVKKWEEFWKENKMRTRCKEMVRRGTRDGEFFLRFFMGKDKVIVRFMNPLLVEDPDNKHSYGIETDPEDIETVINYYYAGKPIPASEVIHDKLNVDSDVKRGRSVMEPVMRPLSQYHDWMIDRMKLNKVRSIVGILKKIKGSTTEARNITSQDSTSIVKNIDGTSKVRLPEGASLISTTPSIDYEFKTPNLQASDVQHDGNALLNQIAAGVGFPNWMITSDPSNSNYASTMVSEAPGVKELEDWQDHFYVTFEMIYEKVMMHFLNSEVLPEKEEVEVKEIDENGQVVVKMVTQDIDAGVHIVFPELVHRDILAETKALTIQMNEGILSKHKYASLLNHDYDEEKEMIKQEKQEEPKEPEENIPDIEDMQTEEAFKKARNKYVNRNIKEAVKRKTVRGYLSPEPGDISEKENDILANAYASARESGKDRKTSAKIAWGAVDVYRKKHGGKK